MLPQPVVDYYPCQNEYQEHDSTTRSQAPPCACGTFSIGQCAQCGVSVCGDHSEIWSGERLCRDHSAQAAAAAVEARGVASRAQAGRALEQARVDVLKKLVTIKNPTERLLFVWAMRQERTTLERLPSAAQLKGVFATGVDPLRWQWDADTLFKLLKGHPASKAVSITLTSEGRRFNRPTLRAQTLYVSSWSTGEFYSTRWHNETAFLLPDGRVVEIGEAKGSRHSTGAELAPVSDDNVMEMLKMLGIPTKA